MIAGLDRVAGRVGLAVFGLFLGCAGPTSAPPIRTRVASMELTRAVQPERLHAPRPTARGSTIVVITLDGIRWQEVFRGVDPVLAKEYDLGTPESASRLVPRLQHLMHGEGAVIGAPGHGAVMSAVGPAFISMPGYVEILRGRPVPDCWSNDCSLPVEPSLLDELAAQPGARTGDVAMFASWRALERFGSDRVLVSAGKSGGVNQDRLEADPEMSRWLEAGKSARDRLGGPGYRPDRHTGELALRYLAAFAPRFLFVSLGDSDEHGHANDYAGYLGALREADRFVGRVVDVLRALRAQGSKVTLMVTTDHGRDATAHGHGPAIPASGRVWLIAWGDGIVPHGIVESPRPRYLIDIAPTIRALSGLDADTRPGAGRVLSELVEVRN